MPFVSGVSARTCMSLCIECTRVCMSQCVRQHAVKVQEARERVVHVVYVVCVYVCAVLII